MSEPASETMIYVVGHVTRGFGAVQALQAHLMRRGAAFCAIEHPLFAEASSTTQAFASTYHRYARGAVVVTRRGPSLRRPPALRFLKDVAYTVWCGLREPGRIDLYIGIDNLNAFSGLVLRAVGKTRRVVFYTVDYAKTARFSNPVLDAFYRWVDRVSVWGADEVWNVSERIRQERVRVTSDPKKLRVVPNTVDLSQVPDLTQVARVQGRLIFIGGLVQESGLDQLIDALPAIRQRVPNVSLVVIGGGPSEPALRRLVERRGLQAVVQFLGYRPYEEALRHVAQASVGFSPYSPTAPEAPYLYFCDPSKVKAYLACGCPVIIYDLPEIAQVIAREEAGLVYRTREELIEAVVRVLTDDLLLARHRANAVRLAAQFDQTQVFQRVLDGVAA